ncbi:MAG: serine phosphatase RsbU (regulator of sigma subunit) [Crocinitomicaceae bacterium]|jgi:serine phosphatase RsbU (regulator of sigma subunit)
MFVIYLLTIGLSTFFLLFGYFNQLALQEKGQYDKLSAVVGSVAIQIDGDEIEQLMLNNKFGSITDVDSDKTYQKYNEIMNKAVKINTINSPMYMLTYDTKNDVFLYGIRSGDNVYFKDSYKEYPEVLKTKMKVGGTIPRYETENGIWLSAFYPIQSSDGRVVALLEADEDFTSFIADVRSEYLTNALGMFVIILVIALILTLYARKILREEDAQKKLLLEQKLMIEEKNKSISDSIDYALKIQSSLLPSDGSFDSNFNDYFIFYRPKDVVSGDFYWLEKLGDDVFIAVADCTGHGVPGAMVSVICSNALNRVVKELQLRDPGDILDRVADIVCDRFTQGNQKMSDGMDISFCRINLETLELEYSGANNPIYILSKDDFQIFPSSRQPIGVYHERKKFEKISRQLSSGDEIFLFSDGFADQFGGEGGKKFKYKPFKDLIATLSGKPMKEQHDLLGAAFDNWKMDHEQVDDVCVVGIRI